MQIPRDAYRPLLLEDTMAIGAQQREADFPSLTVITPPDFRAVEDVYYISFTNVHMVPGDPVPRLRRVQLHNPDVPADVPDDVVAKLADQIEEGLPHLHEDHMRATAESAIAACEEIDEEERSPFSQPFQTIAVMGISLTMDGHPLVMQHNSKRFAETMSGHFSERWQMDKAEFENPSDDLFRTAYAIESEHQELPPFDEWKEIIGASMGEIVDAAQDTGDIMAARCQGYMSYMLCREATMHPAIAKLFKE